MGLDLLRLLVQNRIAEFHTEMELIPPAAHSHPGIQYVIQLEQWLMEGAYNKVLAASKKLPTDAHALLVQQIATTVREEIASCSEKAYDKLRLVDAQKMMMLGSEKEVCSDVCVEQLLSSCVAHHVLYACYQRSRSIVASPPSKHTHAHTTR